MSSESHTDRNNQVRSPPGNGPVGNGEVDGEHVDLVLRMVSRLGEPVRIRVPLRLRDSEDEKTDANSGTATIKRERQLGLDTAGLRVDFKACIFQALTKRS
jgi:hypothetical protein